MVIGFILGAVILKSTLQRGTACQTLLQSEDVPAHLVDDVRAVCGNTVLLQPLPEEAP